MEGRAQVLLGEYVGAEHYLVSVLQRHRDQKLTPAMHGLFGVHTDDDKMQDQRNNFFFGLTFAKVNQVMAQIGYRLTSDQVAVVNRMGQST